MEINEKNCPRTFAATRSFDNEFIKGDFVPASLCAKLEQRLVYYKQKLEEIQKKDDEDNRPMAR